MVIWPWRRAARKARQEDDAAPDTADAQQQWVQVGSYAGHFDADVDRVMLETAGIPVLVKGASAGIFGPGFSGPTAEGVRLFVPGSRLAAARELLAADNGDADT